MKKTNLRRRLIACSLLLTLLLSLSLPVLGASVGGENITVTNADPQPAVRYAPYVLPAEAEDAVYVPLTLLQSGSLAARWPTPGPHSQAGAEDVFLDALRGFAPGVDIKAYGLTQQQAVDLMNNTINTHPELFYFNGIYTKMDGAKVSYIWFMYTAALSVVEAQAAVLEAEVDYILGLIPTGLSAAEKVLWVNEYLAMNVYYPVFDEYDSLEPYWFNVYGTLVDGVAVCQGYALANCLLLSKLGVNCAFVTSEPMNHAWNLVQLDGQWYHVDTTWNDGASDYGVLDVPGYVNHKYFLLSDAVMRDAAHAHRDWIAPAAANSNSYQNYFWTTTTSAIVPLDGKWYYFEDSNAWIVSGNTCSIFYNLHCYDFADGSNTSSGTLGYGFSPVPSNMTKFKAFRRTPSLAAWGGKLYTNDGANIFSMDTALGNRETVQSEALNQANYQSIAGFAIQQGQIRYGVFDLSGSTGRLYSNQPGPVLAPAPTLPAVPSFTVSAVAVSLRYHSSFQLTATPAATGFVSDDRSLVTVDADGTLRNVAFGKDAVTGVWVYGEDGACDYVLVAIYTEWWQWLIWIFVAGYFWY
jgi:hypothetical protein